MSPRTYIPVTVNEAAVAEALAGGNPYLAPKDRRAVIRSLAARGVHPATIAIQLGISRRTVDRVRPRVESDAQRWARYRRELPQIVATRFPREVSA